MDLFDKYIVNTADLLGGYPSERFAFSKNKIWETSAHAEFMTQKESQAELGGGDTPSLGFTVPSSDSVKPPTVVRPFSVSLVIVSYNGVYQSFISII